MLKRTFFLQCRDNFDLFSNVFERIKDLEKVFELQKVKVVVIDNNSPEAEAGHEKVQSNEKISHNQSHDTSVICVTSKARSKSP